jgi:hypothetical protein
MILNSTSMKVAIALLYHLLYLVLLSIVFLLADLFQVTIKDRCVVAFQNELKPVSTPVMPST